MYLLAQNSVLRNDSEYRTLISDYKKGYFFGLLLGKMF